MHACVRLGVRVCDELPDGVPDCEELPVLVLLCAGDAVCVDDDVPELVELIERVCIELGVPV